MLRRQISRSTAQQNQPVDDVLGDPVVPRQPQIFVCQLLRDTAACILAAAEQLMFRYLQYAADILQKSYVRVTQPRFP